MEVAKSAEDDCVCTSTVPVVLQGFVAFWSLISTLTVINVWDTDNQEAIAVVVITIGLLRWMLGKLD